MRRKHTAFSTTSKCRNLCAIKSACLNWQFDLFLAGLLAKFKHFAQTANKTFLNALVLEN